ncbi:MAG: hypothetical protein JOZ94_05785 [Xanthobacteraceae bacterium]|nr:hypothetical protein [Xanthobacteraceae bacterium]MBV9627010.1 hypothetical protein [Xanthobacteraceae bacterium]
MVDRLRADIDRGKTGDKVPAADPAAVPLGTDDEFADVAPASSAAARTHAREIATGPAQPPQRMRGLGHAWILVGLVVLLAAGLIGAMIAWRG